eukprot:6273471-Pyramimonas_sp.AAC.1
MDRAEEDAETEDNIPIQDGDLFARRNTFNSVINWRSGEEDIINKLKESYMDDVISNLLADHAQSHSCLTSVHHRKLPWSFSQALRTIKGPWERSCCFLLCMRAGEVQGHLGVEETDNLNGGGAS